MPLVRGRKRRAEAEGEENEYATPASSPEPAPQRRRTSPASENDEAYGGDAGNQAREGQEQMVKKLVRLALACEYQRRPIRRADITEKVLGSGGGRSFKEVFNTAQHHLRTVFGMEMVELPGREKVTVQQKRAAQKSAASQAPKHPATWTLTTILPPRFRVDPSILPPPAAPTSAEESTYTSLYTLLCSLILLSGGSLPQAKMERYLCRLGLEDVTPLDGNDRKTEKLLKRMEKEGYIVKVKENAGQGEEDVFWILGPRGRVEVGEQGCQGLVRQVYGELDEMEGEELERRIGRSLGLGEGAPPKATQVNGAARKKRGRPRRDAEEEEDGEVAEEEDDE